MKEIIVFFLAACGFAVSWWIWRKKAKNEKLVCVIGDDCDKVVRSKYSSVFFGVPNEVLGMTYYALVLAVSLFLFFGFTEIFGTRVFSDLLVISGLAAFFSAVLVGIQIFVIKEWCEYCLASAIFSIGVFIALIV